MLVQKVSEGERMDWKEVRECGGGGGGRGVVKGEGDDKW